VLRFADQLTATPANVPDELYAAVRALFGEAGVVELASAIAWENYRARFNRAFEVENEGFCSLDFHGKDGESTDSAGATSDD
jgi:alkylhydroperoxidase family enzyme